MPDKSGQQQSASSEKSAGAEGLRIFLSYRRQDTEDAAGRLDDALSAKFGPSVFMDVDNIPPGVNFRRVLDEELAKCDVLIAVVGARWLTVEDPTGHRRFDHPDDPVRLEIAAALRREVPIIPVLVQQAVMPKADDLPEDIRDFADWNGVRLDHARWRQDVAGLIDTLTTIADAKAERVWQQLTARQAKDESERQALEESKRRAREESERRVKEEWDRRAKEELDRRAREESARRDRMESERRAKEESQPKVSVEVVRIDLEVFPSAISLSPDGLYLAISSRKGIVVVGTMTGTEVARMEEDASDVSFSPDGRYLATAGGHAKVVEVTTWEQVTRVEQTGHVYHLSFSPDGRYLATASYDHEKGVGAARVFEVITGKLVAWPKYKSELLDVCFSPDGRYLATAGADKSARVFEAMKGKELARMKHGAAVWAVSFSPDGHYLASGSHDKTARVFEARRGKELVRIQHAYKVYDVAFSPDGRYLATATESIARIFEASNGKEVARIDPGRLIENSHGYLQCVCFTKDGRYLITGTRLFSHGYERGGAVQVWLWRPGAAPAERPA